MTLPSKKNPVRFFYDHAGYSQLPGESRYQARLRCARLLADAEQRASERGLVIYWADSQDAWDGDCEPPAYCFDGMVLREADMRGDYPCRGAKCLASLGMVGVEGTRDPYLRVVAAELFNEALAVLDSEDRAEADKLASRATFAGVT